MRMRLTSPDPDYESLDWTCPQCLDNLSVAYPREARTAVMQHMDEAIEQHRQACQGPTFTSSMTATFVDDEKGTGE